MGTTEAFKIFNNRAYRNGLCFLYGCTLWDYVSGFDELSFYCILGFSEYADIDALRLISVEAFAQLWVVKYNQPVGIAGLHYLALGLGFAVRRLPILSSNL
jgi:hypothetical protein